MVKVLDNGYVEFMGSFGTDATIAMAARICYQTEAKATPEKDEALLEKLLSSYPEHNTPFEHGVLCFRVKCPIAIARQWVRHRIASINEKSLRYCAAQRDYYNPFIVEADRTAYVEVCESAFDTYEALLQSGVVPEKARMVLPLSTYTEFLWTINVWSLMNFIIKRTDKHAQEEMRQYAEVVLKLFSEAFPTTARLFEIIKLGRG